MSYTPPNHILRAYANVLVNFALGDGKGVQKGEVVNVILKESVKPLRSYPRSNPCYGRTYGLAVYSRRLG